MWFKYDYLIFGKNPERLTTMLSYSYILVEHTSIKKFETFYNTYIDNFND